jgi:beta-lactamase regulating signal transducer with metallopeptidase domain
MLPDSILPLLSNQIIQVSCVAVLAILITRWARGARPHLVHAIWMIVLLKCITPPIISSPTSPFSWLQTAIFAPKDARDTTNFQLSNRYFEPHVSRASLSWPVDENPQSAEPNNNFRQPLSFDWMATGRGLKRFAGSLNLNQLLVLGWLIIAVVVFAIILFRLLKFLGVVKQAKICDSTFPDYSLRMSRLVSTIESKLGMRHRTRVEVVDALIGPAIVGIFRPTILLPKVIVDSSSNKNLETLIAHELVHFRRGDLWWSALQTLAVCCYWFHPLIWFARSAMNREAEKCCDEETIGSLQCDPGDYARCLISVLECKQSLRAAPLLPGVRPVDITAKRLERIMRLGHGSYSHCPTWVRLTMVVGAIILLPGATLTLAQQGGGSKRSTNSDAKKPLPPDSPAPMVLPLLPQDKTALPLSTEKAPDRSEYRLESMEITDVLNKFRDTENLSMEQAVKKLIVRLPSPIAQKDVWVEIDGSKNAIKLGGDQPTIHVAENRLYVLGTEAERNSIRSYLDHYRHFGNKILVFELRILDVPTKSLDALAIQWDSKQSAPETKESKEGEVVPASFKSARMWTSNNVARFETSQIKELIASDGCVVISSPKLVSLHAQTAKVQIGSIRPFVVGHTAIKDKDGKPTDTFQPEISMVEEGIKLELEGRSIANDSSKLAVRLNLTNSKVMDVKTVDYEENGKELSIESPNVRQRSIQTVFEQVLGSTFAVTSNPERVDTVTERAVPLLGKLPFVGGTFKNTAMHSELRTQVVLITSTLVDGPEESPAAANPASETKGEIFDKPTFDTQVKPQPTPARRPAKR